jgi:hypothetical protein
VKKRNLFLLKNYKRKILIRVKQGGWLHGKILSEKYQRGTKVKIYPSSRNLKIFRVLPWHDVPCLTLILIPIFLQKKNSSGGRGKVLNIFTFVPL